MYPSSPFESVLDNAGNAQDCDFRIANICTDKYHLNRISDSFIRQHRAFISLQISILE
jgi:hypothetical protein